MYSGSDEAQEEVGEGHEEEGEGQEQELQEPKQEVPLGEGQKEEVDTAAASMSHAPHTSQEPGQDLEGSAASSKTLTAEHAPYHSAMENGLTGQLQAAAHPDGHTPRTGDPTALPKATRFNNLLDKCDAAESDIVKPKPRAPTTLVHPSFHHQPEPTYPGHLQPALLPARPRTDTVSSIDMPGPPPPPPAARPGMGSGDIHSHLTTTTTTSPELSPSPLGDLPEDPGPLQSFLFPISNSPIDMVCMLSRLASFTGELLAVLTPKIRKTVGGSKVWVSSLALDVSSSLY